MKKSKMFLGFMGPLKCVVCGCKYSKPVILMSGHRYCPRCARFALNFAHDLSKAFNLPGSDEGGNS